MVIFGSTSEQQAVAIAKQLIHISPKEAPRLLGRHVRLYKKEGNTLCALQARRYQCYALMGNLDFPRAKLCLERLFEEANDAGQRRFIGIGAMYLGIIATENGEIDIASECYDRAIGIGTELEDLDLIRRVQVNLAYAQMMMERYDEAMETLRDSIRLFEGAEADNNAAVAFKNVAYVHAYQAFESAIDGTLDPNQLVEARKAITRSYDLCRDDYRLESTTRLLDAMLVGMEVSPGEGLKRLAHTKDSVFQRAAVSVSLTYLSIECNLLELAKDWKQMASRSLLLLKLMRRYRTLAQFETISKQCARAHANLRDYRTAYKVLDQGAKYLATIRSSTGLTGNYISNLRFDLQQKKFDESVLRLRNRSLAEQNRILEQEARLDPLSRLLNRRGVEEAMVDLVENQSARQFAIAILDIDLFKRINDSYGHSIGDQAITEFARCLTESSTLPIKIGRWGGEEFILILNATSESDLDGLGEVLIEEIRNFEWSKIHPDLSLTASCGLALWRRGDSIDHVTKLADEMLYVVKQNGRNGWCVGRHNNAA